MNLQTGPSATTVVPRAPAHLSALAPKAGAGEGMSRRDAPNGRGAQKAHPARREGPGRHWELPLGPSDHPHPHRASYGK